jgi:hypothetical protein
MDASALYLPLIGIIVGWLLKSLADVFINRAKTWSTRRRCVYQLLRTWKDVLDYDRMTDVLTEQHAAIEDFEDSRNKYGQILLARLEAMKTSIDTSIEELSTIDPTAATQLENTLKVLKHGMANDYTEVIRNNAIAYNPLMHQHHAFIAWALADLEHMCLRLARRSGFGQKRKAKKWFKARLIGSSEFTEGVTAFNREVEDRRRKESEEEQ